MYEVDPSQVILKSRLKPGRMLLVDTQEKSVIQDIELKQEIANSRPHSEWLKEQVIIFSKVYLKYYEHGNLHLIPVHS